MTEGTCIETERLTLRTVTMDDIDEVARTWNLDRGPTSRDDAEAQIRRMLKNHRRNAQGSFVHLCLAIVHKNDGPFIGWCGLDHTNAAEKSPVLFYLLLREYWGRGLATEAARAVLRHGLYELRIRKIVAGASAENLASKRVLEKLGMHYLGEDSNGGFSFDLPVGSGNSVQLRRAPHLTSNDLQQKSDSGTVSISLSAHPLISSTRFSVYLSNKSANEFPS